MFNLGLKTREMGIIICPKHGTSGIAICIEKAICHKILQNIPVQDNELAVIRIEVFDFDRETFVTNLNHLITKKLKEERDLQDYYKIVTEDEFEQLDTKMDVGATCVKCFEEFARANEWSELFIYYAEKNL